MSQPKGVTDLALALRLAYPGPGKVKRIADDLGVGHSTAKNLLNGRTPAVWARFLRLIERRPVFLAHALKTTWAEELAVRSEIAATRRRLDEMERRLAKNQTVAGKTSQ